MRTPEQMAHDVNNLNCHARGGGYGPLTPRQVEAIYREARQELQSRVAELEKDKALAMAVLGRMAELARSSADDAEWVLETLAACETLEQMRDAMKGTHD